MCVCARARARSNLILHYESIPGLVVGSFTCLSTTYTFTLTDRFVSLSLCYPLNQIAVPSVLMQLTHPEVGLFLKGRH